MFDETGEKGKKSNTMSKSQGAAKEHKEQLERLQKKVSSFVSIFFFSLGL